MIGLIHEAFVVLYLIIKLFLNIVLHLVRYQPACNLIRHLAQQREVIRCEVLITLFICDFKDTYCMITKLDWNEKYIANDLMKLLVHGHVISEFISHVFIHSFLEVSRLSCIEYLTEHVLPIIWRFPLETHRLPQPACNHFAEQLIFDTIVKENRATFDVKQIR